MRQNNKSPASKSPRSNTSAATIASADRVLDITRDICPMTFVRTRLALDAMSSGQTLLVLLRGEEPRARVPQTAASLGHAVLSQNDQADGTTQLLLRRA